jgi:2-dehydro-3-deoxyphosphogluconate aldolase/(4S)-4-hydroxy-2-oxoglutarate aldolase
MTSFPDKLTADELQQIGLVAIVRTGANAPFREIAAALLAGGLRVMEITLTTPGALAAITLLRREFSPNLRIGVGTVLEVTDALAAFDAGAEFVVTPTLQLETVAACRERGIPIACGSLTPTEALAAHRAGADFIKLFPADTLGPAYVRAILGPLPFLKIIPTGGVNLETLGGFIQAGCVGTAIGSNLVSKQILQEQDWKGLETLARQYVAALDAARSALAR